MVKNYLKKKISILDSKEYSHYENNPGIKHISGFYSQENENAREEARLWILSISKAICSHTGKPFYQSLMYKGISAFWFIEINLHEPAYLAMRKEAALKRAKKEFRVRDVITTESKSKCKTLPLVGVDVLENVTENLQKKYLKLAILGMLFPLYKIYKKIKKVFKKEKKIEVKKIDPGLKQRSKLREIFRKVIPFGVRRILALSFVMVKRSVIVLYRFFLKLKSGIKRSAIFLMRLIKGAFAFLGTLKAGIKQMMIKMANSATEKLMRQHPALAIIEEENLRSYYGFDSNEIWTCLPYAEGVIEKLNDKLGDELVVLTRNAVKKQYPTWSFLNNALPMVELNELSEEHKTVLEEFYKKIESKLGKYIGPALLEEVLRYRLAEYDMYLNVLEKVNPKTVFVYNWEGVFRPLVTAAREQGRKIVGIQQALGPYLHGLDHKEIGYWTPEHKNVYGFCVPDQYLLWSEYHRENILSFGYDPKSLIVTGYCRMDRHAQLKKRKEAIREQVCQKLQLNPKKRYLLLTAQYAILDTCLIIKENYRALMTDLLELAEKHDFSIIVKPWTSDDMDFLRDVSAQNPKRVFFAPQNIVLHNADLLSITEWCVGTFSSIMGEATLLGNACFLLNYPESRYYFEPKYMETYRDMAVFIDSPQALKPILSDVFEGEEKRTSILEKAENTLKYIFGSCDGKAAERCSDIIQQSIH